ncbi:phosphonoacetaldehyde hydrolase [Companilactobacillus allii]|uniref:Phosphonoacetaldehyde hydrolase n=1 Tax=Companilactobacillus allii TaxID=1847728 RepID=A0A1P8PZU3_9LACO|nr:phosphonoacetaldehyde hydrolase [Companilactobacillus allii]APX71140.1 phosphonoacetaldehyde hydrolase [Companilactobacillus allii]USQ68221.1 phosphonoacetaldehyde hydrolase [Companilactobacillus allii]
MIKTVIFDWAGTTVDYGSCAPVIAFKRAFNRAGITILDSEIRKNMGIAKWDHINKIMEIPRIQDQWKEIYYRLPNEEDRENVYGLFQESLIKHLKVSTKLKPGMLETFKYLTEHSIRVATTTGYTLEMMNIVRNSASSQGYLPELVVTSEDVSGQGRPSPAMIKNIVSQFSISDLHSVLKIGDTISDIQEGQNAGVITVGVIEGSSLMGLSEDEFNRLTKSEQVVKRNEVRKTFEEVGSDIIINNMFELPDVIQTLNASEEVANG